MSPSLSSNSAASTPQSTYFRERNSLDRNLDHLSTTVESEIIDTADVGRLTLPLFSEQREASAIPFSVSGSQAH